MKDRIIKLNSIIGQKRLIEHLMHVRRQNVMMRITPESIDHLRLILDPGMSFVSAIKEFAKNNNIIFAKGKIDGVVIPILIMSDHPHPYDINKKGKVKINPLWVHHMLLSETKTFSFVVDDNESIQADVRQVLGENVDKINKKIKKLLYPYEFYIGENDDGVERYYFERK